MLKKIKTSLLEIAYQERGGEDAPPIILMHGFPDDANTWDKVAPRLASEGFRTLAPYVRGYGNTRFLANATQRSGQHAALTQDMIEFADALNLDRFIFVGHDWGAAIAYMLAILYPARVQALVVLSGGYGMGLPGYVKQPVAIAQARAYWYQWYFNHDKGREALEANRRELCRELWKAWAPSWRFSKSAFEKTAESWSNPDFVDVVIHSYRYRWQNAAGDPRYDEIEAKLAKWPKISVPAAVIHGDEDGATLPTASEGKDLYFTAEYQRRVLHGVGHFIQREQPDAVIDTVLKIARKVTSVGGKR